ncbi:MAG: hypothetical protein HKM98_09610, partial [Gammaproteobacteria bacterium]|nr:hypothetical protein [Gammaproteobacteria bacterium]
MKDISGHATATPSEYATCVIRLLSNAQRSVEIFSPEMKPAVFSSIELVDAARDFILRSRNCEIRILLRSTAALTRNDHRFLHLIQRVSSRIGVR